MYPITVSLLLAMAIFAMLPGSNGEGQGELRLYKLRIQTHASPDLDDRWLTARDSVLTLAEDDEYSPIRVYTTEGAGEDLLQLHTYPIGIIDHVLGLRGPPGLLDLVDTIPFLQTEPEDGQILVWDTFRFARGRVLNDGEGEWLAFPDRYGDWTVKWYDGTVLVPAIYIPVNITYVRTRGYD
jgi:hypothetical protein